MDRYNDLLNKLKKATVITDSKAEIVKNVMLRLDQHKKESLIDRLFAWTDILWLRRSLSFASVIVIIIFVFQQSVILNKIGRLDDRIISINTQNILDHQKDNAIINAAIIESEEYADLKDSISVSVKDINSMIKSYRELQKKYDELQRAVSGEGKRIIMPVPEGNGQKL